jgi:molybdenum cofactor biosynthesis protein MoaC
MVNVTNKNPTQRTATATGRIFISQVAYELIGGIPPITGSTQNSTSTSAELEVAKAKARAKGDVLSVAQLAGIMAAKRTSDLIPLCHPLSLSHISVVLTPYPGSQGSTSSHSSMPSVYCESSVTCEGKTGVEMEALSAVSVALLTVWDMLKAVAGKEMKISDIHVSKKTGGKSGDFERVDGQDVHIGS